MGKNELLGKTILIILAIILSIIAVFPFYWMIASSFKTDEELYLEDPTFIPNNPTIIKYIDAFVKVGFLRYIINSALVAGISSAIALALAVLAGYGFARYQIPGGKVLLFGILLTYTFPRILTAIPFYFLFRQLHLLDTLTSLVIVYNTFALPYAIWIMRNYFLNLPVEVEECAMIDGCTRLGAVWKVVLPVAKPAIAAVFIYCFIRGWNEFMFANTFITDESLRTLPIGLNSIIGQYTTDWGLLMAGAVISSVPVVLIFSFLQKHLVKGLSAGATKG